MTNRDSHGVPPGCILGENVHWVVDLDIHVVAYSGELFPLRGNDFPTVALDFPGR